MNVEWARSDLNLINYYFNGPNAENMNHTTVFNIIPN